MPIHNEVQSGASGALDHDPRSELHLVVSGKQLVATDVVAIELRSAEGTPLPPWEPGAHIELKLPTAQGELRRQYSLCGDLHDRMTWRIAVLREPASRGGSAHVHDGLALGDTVTVTGPRNNFRLEPSKEYLLVAGGIGLTPILAMAHSITERGEPWHLVCCARTKDRIVFADELAALPCENVTIHIDERDGLLDIEALMAGRGAETSVFVCGPPGLLHAFEGHADHAPWRYFSEQFIADHPVAPGSNQPFEVVVSSTDETYMVPADRSALDVLNDAGFDIAYSCQEGTCGTCETGVLDGIPDHRDVVLSRDEKAQNDCMMLCVSRAKSARLVLDL
ncbi:oxidoreductase (plasmid) [Rhodococcus rhodochrous]|uniref:PDR/VanB family oxidoreductase n=1 Tax=Rhodococcus rhodochrous TaxID=1829 RepID=UPI00132EB978|nr:PDR/VanB family oxidoreductase [Rhodococcus rhodochrous]QHG85515.1 oxidoreductase [Rhodococcus rhodochrous]